ncbi:hypothetical protein Y032_0007g3568 [Ancylostoma ceylanicum]|uniref:Uncharacterized protein n=1 Tax=Ancylostoma ceylanicum TaxID=53326 RepID=A0A016VP48_9BILA|nr:hypothetical protein Y032_0007g3568 [Ancylostoma ceylanicum]
MHLPGGGTSRDNEREERRFNSTTPDRSVSSPCPLNATETQCVLLSKLGTQQSLIIQQCLPPISRRR